GDTIDGGIGIDVAAYGASASAVNVDLQANTASGGDAAGDVLSNIEGLSGSAFADQLSGDGNANRLFGLAGIDVIQGRAGNDFLDGGAGNDSLDGGADTDTVDYSATTLGVVVDLAAGTATGSESGSDTIIAVENANGGSGNDDLAGTSGDN